MNRTGKHLLLVGLILAYSLGVCADPVPQVKNIHPLPAESVVGQPITAVIPLSGTGYITVLHNWIVFDVTGTMIDDFASSQYLSAATEGWSDLYFQRIVYTPTSIGSIVLSVTDPSIDEWATWTARVVAPGKILQSTMYYLTSSISRDDSWTVSSPIVRSCSAYYDSALEEVYVNDQDEIVDYHVSVYDYSTAIENFVQKRWDYWGLTQSEVTAILQRAVPDGDETRYHVQE
ncbi:MAG: hypothetical protein AB1656_05135 [Candidatus Omnitrophota bacterium]